MKNLEIKIEEEGNRGHLYIGEKNNESAYMAFRKVGDHLIIIDHTEVKDTLKGQRAGRKMVDFIVELARKRNAKIVPLCPYAISVFKKDPSIADVLR